MERRKLVMAGALAGSIGLGGVIGAVVFAPGVGLAAAETPNADRMVEVCAGVLGARPIAAAADAIGIETRELVRELADGRTIAEVIEDHGVEVSVVVDAIVAAEQELLGELAQDGRLTEEQADRLAADLEERATDLVNGDLVRFPLPGPHRPWFPGAPILWMTEGPVAVAADAIGIETRELVNELADGRTIAEVAEEHGVEIEAVIDTLVEARQRRLDAAVADGQLTQERADAIAAELEEQATAFVNGEPPPFPGRPFMGPPWHRGPFLPPFDRPETERDLSLF